MGNALVVAVVPEEEIGRASIWTWVADTEHGKRLAQVHELYSQEEWWALRNDTAEVLRRHPDAFYQLCVRIGDVWEPPLEPRGLGDRDRALRAQHTRAVSISLENFLRAHLKSLEGMVRTGWWILRTVDVKITRLRGTPDLKRRAGGLRAPAATKP